MIRVLHVVENFNGQAVESWLTRLIDYENYDSTQLHFDFFLLGVGSGGQADAVLQHGCKLHQGNLGGASIPQMARALRRVVKEENYDVVHIHQDVMGGIFALALLGTGSRVMIHAHNCWQRLPVGGKLKEKVLTWVARQLVLWRADAIIGVSRQALITMTGGRERNSRKDRVIYCSAKGNGTLMDAAQRRDLASQIRASYELPPTAKILFFLGRLDEYKNPEFALQVLAKMIADGQREVYLVVAGVGGLATALDEFAAKQGIADHFRNIGWIEDPVPLLLAADLLLMPSAEWCGEGLGLAAVEAQGCGLPVLCSLSIPEDAEIVPGLFERRSLNEGTGSWAQAANGLLARGRGDQKDSMARLFASPFTDAASYKALAELYAEVIPRAHATGRDLKSLSKE